MSSVLTQEIPSKSVSEGFEKGFHINEKEDAVSSNKVSK